MSTLKMQLEEFGQEVEFFLVHGNADNLNAEVAQNDDVELATKAPMAFEPGNLWITHGWENGELTDERTILTEWSDGDVVVACHPAQVRERYGDWMTLACQESDSPNWMTIYGEDEGEYAVVVVSETVMFESDWARAEIEAMALLKNLT